MYKRQTFGRVRPVQLEFKDNQLAVIVTGRRFAQGARAIRAGLRFRLTFRIVRQGGSLRLFRVGETEIEYTEPDKKDAKLVAFRSLLEKRLNEATEVDEGVELPANLIPKAMAKGGTIAEGLILNTLRMEGGWLYLGWNRSYGFASDLAAIWDEGTLPVAPVPAQLEEPETDVAKGVTLPMSTAGGDWNSSVREPNTSVWEPVAIEQDAVILTGAEAPIMAGQVIEGEIVHEVIVDGTVSDIPVSAGQ